MIFYSAVFGALSRRGGHRCKEGESMNAALRRDADVILRSSLNAVLPDEAVRRALRDLRPGKGRVLLVAAGKAAWQMAHAAVETLGRVDGGVVVTNDYNLNKVAAVRKVPVFNINELANALKPIAMPGEEMSVFVVKEGKEAGQGIGYMDDGTMIVIENGRRLVGETVDVTVTSVLQTSAGRMIFAKVKQA